MNLQNATARHKNIDLSLRVAMATDAIVVLEHPDLKEQTPWAISEFEKYWDVFEDRITSVR